MKRSILIFDDEVNIAYSVKSNLELYDFDVTLVSTITQFYDKIEDLNTDFSILIIDIMSPIPTEHSERSRFTSAELNSMYHGIRVGETLVSKLRNSLDCKYHNIPVLFYSIRENVSGFSNSKLVKKPALVNDLITEINSLLIK